MRARAFIRRVTAAALLPLVVLVGLSTAHAAYRCAGDRVLRTTCCCPKSHQQTDERDSDAHIKKAFCCSIERTAAIESPPAQVHERDAASSSAAPMTLFAIVIPAPVVAPDVTRVPDPRQQLAPPRTTASLFSQRIALLV